MEKSATLNLRINPSLKKDAEAVLSKLGVPMSTAIDIYLNQIVLSGGIPFSVTLPKPPKNIDASQLSEMELHEMLKESYEQIAKGEVQDAREAFKELEEKYFK